MIPNQPRQLIREFVPVQVWAQMLLDNIAVQGLLFVHTYMKTGGYPIEYGVLAIITFLLMMVIYSAVGVYKHQLPGNDYLACLMEGWGILILVLAIMSFITKTSEIYSREVILTWGVTGFIAQVVNYYLTRKLTSWRVSKTVPTLVIGAQDLGQHIATSINKNHWLPDHVVGILEDDERIVKQLHSGDIPVLGGIDDAEDVVDKFGIRRVYLAMPLSEGALIKPLSSRLVHKNVDVIWAPDIFGVSLLNHSVKEFAGVPLISLSETPLVGAPAIVKTMMDKSIAAITLILVSPIMLATAVAIKLTSPGPVLFKQQRHGWDGRIVRVYKFRSMVEHSASEGSVKQATRDDPRVTAVGRFIRRTSIDELPQLFNVLEGSMSLVGPRPHAIAHNEFYSGKIDAYMLRHRIKPGLTGLAQINGFRGETDTIDKMQSRVNYDLAYINNWSISLDIEILIRTVFVLFGRNAY